ncbi:MAG: hypothetical protein AAFV90_26500 [Cyanobacteria bacterium J06634_5]
MTQSIARTNTPQQYFEHVGNLESQTAIARIAQQMVNHEECGLKYTYVNVGEENLLQAFDVLLANHSSTSREEWVGLKESCLLLLGPPTASCIDYLISGLRTSAIAELAIWSAGMALIFTN